MKTHRKNSVSKAHKTGPDDSLDTKQIWDRLPAWLQNELSVTASLISNPSTLEMIVGDVQPRHFFKPESEASIDALLNHYQDTGEALRWEDLEAKLKALPWLKASEVELHIRLLRFAPLICEWHLVNTVLWFTTERRVFRGISDAAEAIDEQEMDWNQAMSYIFQAIDLPHLKDNGVLARIQAAVLASDTCAQPAGYCPDEWRNHLRREDGSLDESAVKILSQLVSLYVGMRAFEGVPSVTRESPEFEGVTAAEAKAALAVLGRAGLIAADCGKRLGKGKEEAVMLLRPTAKALIPMLKKDQKHGAESDVGLVTPQSAKTSSGTGKGFNPAPS